MTILLDASAADQIAAIASGQISAPDLAAQTLDRIAARNCTVNAIISLRPRDEILAEAAHLPAGPLHGLPMAIKDLADTAGIVTTYGHPSFATHIPKTDAPMVARLRAAGALIIGKTNTPEFGLGSHSFNPVHGTTRNPYDLSRSAGGSSGGAGAALACRMVALADGSDMMGSLRNPAAWNNVYGLRPGFGVVPNTPVGDMFLHPLSTDGPMARSPQDLALLLSVQSAHDPLNPNTAGPYRPTPARPLRIGWAGDWGGAYPMEDGVLATCEAALGVWSNLGHTVTAIPAPFDAARLWDAWITLRSWAVAEKQRALYDQPAIRANFKPEAIWEIERGLAMTAAQVHAASAVASDWYRTVARADWDVLALPSAQCFAFDADIRWPERIGGVAMDTYHRWMEVVVPASVIGLPAMSVPAGFRGAQPMGLQLIGKRGMDGLLLSTADGYHAATDWPAACPPVLI
jgi:amidase